MGLSYASLESTSWIAGQWDVCLTVALLQPCVDPIRGLQVSGATCVSVRVQECEQRQQREQLCMEKTAALGALKEQLIQVSASGPAPKPLLALSRLGWGVQGLLVAVLRRNCSGWGHRDPWRPSAHPQRLHGPALSCEAYIMSSQMTWKADVCPATWCNCPVRP